MAYASLAAFHEPTEYPNCTVPIVMAKKRLKRYILLTCPVLLVIPASLLAVLASI